MTDPLIVVIVAVAAATAAMQAALAGEGATFGLAGLVVAAVMTLAWLARRAR